MAGRKDYNPTETKRRLCVALKSCGVQHESIARIVGVSTPSLRKWYRAELDDGLARAVAGAAANMFRLSPRQSSTGFMAAKHVLRCFGGDAWKERGSLEIESGPGLLGLMCGDPADVRSRILARIAAQNGPPDAEAAKDAPEAS
jgi:hypothetical protein